MSMTVQCVITIMSAAMLLASKTTIIVTVVEVRGYGQRCQTLLQRNTTANKDHLTVDS